MVKNLGTFVWDNLSKIGFSWNELLMYFEFGIFKSLTVLNMIK